MNPFSSTSSGMNDDIKRTAIRAAVTGAALAAIGSFAYGTGSTAVFGMSVPAAVPLFAAGAISSVVADRTHAGVSAALPLGIGEKLGDISGSAVGALLCGASAAVVMKFGAGLPNESILPAIGLGSISYIVADGVEKTLLESSGRLIF